jgi:hypothetical protein
MEDWEIRDPAEFHILFRKKLAAAGIPEEQWAFWELWVRQYIICCENEGICPGEHECVSQFFEYFKQKERKAWQVEQAERGDQSLFANPIKSGFNCIGNQ